MYSEILLGALVAVGAPQERDIQRIQIDVDVPPVQVEASELMVEGFDIVVPGFHFSFPGIAVYGSNWDWQAAADVHVPGIDIVVPGLQLQVPAIDIDLPAVDVSYWAGDADWRDADWDHGWDDEDLQDVDMDTTFSVNPNAVLGVRNHAGEVIIRTWDRNQVRMQARHSSRDRVKILQSGSSVQIKSESRFGHPDVVDYELTVPSSMALDLWGFYTDISVDGSRNGVRVETLNGDIEVYNAAGELYLRSVEGGVTVQNGQGRLEINNVENGVSVLGFRGELFIESIDGDLRLEDIQGRTVEAKTVDGDVTFSGAINDDGRYRLTTHDGDVILRVPEDINATVSVATFDGEFEAAFPIRLDSTEASRRFSFTLGNGSARIELHSFDGDIQLIRR